MMQRQKWSEQDWRLLVQAGQLAEAAYKALAMIEDERIPEADQSAVLTFYDWASDLERGIAVFIKSVRRSDAE